MDVVEKMEVAKIIKSQISTRELWAIGATNFVSLSSSNYGGLSFKASLFGKKSCVVAIELNAKDLYNVVIFAPRSLKALGSAQDVYAEDLEGIVVEMVEKRFALDK